MQCPVCHADGADIQPVGPTVMVFCCPKCLATVLRNFAHGREPSTQEAAPRDPQRLAS